MSGELYSRYSTCLDVMSETLSLENARERETSRNIPQRSWCKDTIIGISYYLVQRVCNHRKGRRRSECHLHVLGMNIDEELSSCCSDQT